MPAPAVLALLLALAAPADTSPVAVPDSVAGPVMESLISGVLAPDDTVRRRRKSVEVSEWYERRLRIHRYGSYAMYPLFALQAVAGNQIFPDPQNAPGWAKTRSVSQGRTRRTVHALLMLASDAGFTYAGVRLSEQAETSVDKRREHRMWAYGSMATALTGVGLMTFWREK